MTDRPRLYIVFTLDCLPASRRVLDAPTGWETSARAIDAYATTLFRAGLAPTLFVTPEAASEHAPLCNDLGSSGADVGLLVLPHTLPGAKQARYLGGYHRDEQRALIAVARARFQDALGYTPLTVRSAMFSANDETFAVLNALGFRQSSLSNPGRHTPKLDARWDGAHPDPHYANGEDRLVAGSLALIEVPVTADATQRRGGIAPDLAVDNGTLERWHRPLIMAQLERQAARQAPWRTLCFWTTNRYAYHDRTSRYSQTLTALADYLFTLEEQYEVVPVTLTTFGVHYRTAFPVVAFGA